MAAARLVLGSGSPRRREILESLRIPFFVRIPHVDETVQPGEGPDAYLERVVGAKLGAVHALLDEAEQQTAAIILVADTSVIHRGEILGKPANVEHAEAMVRALAGDTHEVKTRFALASSATGLPFHAETVTTKVTFRALSDEEIRDYAASGEGADKAGAYAVQGFGASFVSRIDGNYSNVVGLPACELVVALQRHAPR
ncbi:Maf family protein [Pendulispora albinea]|uniref:dTTP/UTP pyrophosphatase n=1 Tax=Pendulispora albinea TaxID=2741071 RepID=A0ABZ2M420_9BACT